MRFHYALVDDILSREEFDRLVEEKAALYGGAIDETAAALLVVEDIGRAHQKIGSITPSPSLVSLYGRVMRLTEPKEFTRDDGSVGCVARVELADETGSIILVLWDEKAAGIHEVGTGTVLEVIGRPKEGKKIEIHGLAVRVTGVEIHVPVQKESSLPSEADIDARILAIQPPRAFVRRDGGEGIICEAIIGDPTGSARLLGWDSTLFDTLREGASVRITGAKRRSTDDGVEYLLDEGSAIIPLDNEIGLLLTPPGEVMDKGVYSVRGQITTVHPARPFTTRKGDASWVRNLFIDGPLRIVIWGERARDPFFPGEMIEVYNASARLNRYGDVELSVGFGSAISVIPNLSCDVQIEGVIVLSPEGVAFAADGNLYIPESKDLMIAGRYRLKGRLSGVRLSVDEAELIVTDPRDLGARADELVSLSPPAVRY
ncbi:hypothetical protein RJ53_03470 [Methanocalculus chunghsingensis]|uniref:OB domain-containing protein n=1 Tax=Methanocalculus chunghsingensis TaxID=156457 RepID=A0A8J7W910_9EURY|nr:hypothetical protein [Methanocalculus chunghsingensis]